MAKRQIDPEEAQRAYMVSQYLDNADSMLGSTISFLRAAKSSAPMTLDGDVTGYLEDALNLREEVRLLAVHARSLSS